MDERPVWRNVLSILVTCILVIRLLYTCSNMNNRSSYDNNPGIVNFQDTQRIMQESIDRNNKIRAIVSNNILYKMYQGLDSLSPLTKEDYGLIKLEKDTAIYIDLSTKLKIPKNFYFQNNHDDTLKMAFKSPQNLNIFIHDFHSKDEAAVNFKSIKRDKNLQKFKEDKLSIFRMMTYKITKDNVKYNGYAFCFKTDDFQTFFEFESHDLSSDKLREKAVDFLTKNLKADKKK